MTDIEIAALRKRTWHYLEPGVAFCAGMTMNQLKQFCIGAYHPTPDQLTQLSLRLNMSRWP
jgi:hypothetical protein